MERDLLFVIAAPFEDAGQMWFCRDCATVEGMLLANPHWVELLDVRRVAFPRPRAELIALIGEGHQGLPVLVLAEGAAAPGGAKQANGRAFLDEPRAIARYLAETYGGAGPHP